MEASASQVVGSSPAVGEFALHVYKQVHREQIAAEQFENVKEIHQEPLPERIEELIVNALIPRSVELIEDIPVPQQQLIAEETTLNTSSTSTSSATPGVPSATPVSVIEYVALAPVIELSPEELSALKTLQNVFHEKHMEVDRYVLVLKREKEKLRLLGECSFVPPHDLEVLRRHVQHG